jgi:hypothetical protein
MFAQQKKIQKITDKFFFYKHRLTRQSLPQRSFSHARTHTDTYRYTQTHTHTQVSAAALLLKTLSHPAATTLNSEPVTNQNTNNDAEALKPVVPGTKFQSFKIPKKKIKSQCL